MYLGHVQSLYITLYSLFTSNSTVGLVMAGGEAMTSKGLVAVGAAEAPLMPGLVTVGQPS